MLNSTQIVQNGLELNAIIACNDNCVFGPSAALGTRSTARNG